MRSDQRAYQWLITCEHGGNHIPAAYAPYFAQATALLESHRGYDIGALELFQLLEAQLADFSHCSTISRLLVELNRSLKHKDLFSAFSKPLNDALKKQILAAYYLPYRKKVEEKVEQVLDHKQQVIHLSIHSFTPALNGEIRQADIGLLYDPGRIQEKDFCRDWKKALHTTLPQARVRFNYPYRGKADGFTTYLRRRYPHHYLGVELELNQQYAPAQSPLAASIQVGILQSLLQLKANY